MLRKYTVRIARQISDTAEEIYAGHVIDQRQNLAAVFHYIIDSHFSRVTGKAGGCTPKLCISSFQEKISRAGPTRFSKVLELVYHPRPGSASGALSTEAVAEMICVTMRSHGREIVLPHDIEAVLLRSGDLDAVPEADVLVPKADPSREDVFRIKTASAMDWVF
ncbi:hypothetical protein HMI48_00995 [Acidithiobacillus ferrooxidans]|uniref:hypothetical protein n=1 Tax=Acidithiobacillus ferrooxidans TaxID=920 RepID=UPI001C075266|nr:hypothetical protein [Acidithiobacillus ferrooxidans]MBU2772539.1 hypothetical protein [Acidithiobacillus ferrooxidans]